MKLSAARRWLSDPLFASAATGLSGRTPLPGPFSGSPVFASSIRAMVTRRSPPSGSSRGWPMPTQPAVRSPITVPTPLARTPRGDDLGTRGRVLVHEHDQRFRVVDVHAVVRAQRAAVPVPPDLVHDRRVLHE